MATGSGSPPLDSGQRAAVRAQVERLLSAPSFTLSLRRGQLLRYLVERTLTGGEGINEYAIGVDVFEKPPSFDPRIESIVRTEAGRLRQKLKEHYAKDGRQDRVLIEIPLRSYQPVFVFREPEAVPPAAAAAAEPGAPTAFNRWRWPVAALMIIAVLALLAGGGAATLWWSGIRANQPVHSLVVLPFENFSANGADQYLADGLTDELTNEFANWKDLRVVARTSAFQYRGKGADVRRIGRELNADAVLEGSLAKQGDHVRITAQLNRTADGYHLWSHSYDMRSLDMLTVQREIAQAIATAVRRLGGKVPGQASHPSTNNPEALDLYLRASYQYGRLNPASLQQSIGLFQTAIGKDPSYARAYVGLAAAEMELANFIPAAESTEKARAALQQALKLDPDSGDAHGLLAEIVVYHDWDWPGGEREFQLALEKGASPSTRAAYGFALARYSRFAQAQAQCAIAENLEPLGVAPRFCQFYVFYYQRRYAEARQTLLRTLDLNPDLIYAHQMLGRVALIQRDCAEVVRQFEWIAHTLPAPAAAIGLAYECACRGERDRARRYLREAAVSTPPARSYELAIGYVLLQDNDAALGCLRKSGAAREDLPYSLNEPAFDVLRSDPRFVALERTVEPVP
jgi:TolB-like protein/Tfp pilus assembly protein PilF